MNLLLCYLLSNIFYKMLLKLSKLVDNDIVKDKIKHAIKNIN